MLESSSAPLASESSASPLVVFTTQIRSLLGIAFAIPFTIACSFACMFSGGLGRRGLTSFLMRFWSNCLIHVFAIRVRVKGADNLPAAGGGIVVFNHQSHFDIPFIMLSSRRHMRFGAKIELFRIPIFGRAMRAVGTLPIARDNRAEVMRIYRDAERQFRQNTIFVLAPEGTRQKEPVLGRFKKGPFLFAINAGVPVIPVVIRGAHSVMAKNSLNINVGRLSRVVTLEYLAPVSTQGLKPTDVEELMQGVRAKMVTRYTEV